MPGLSRLTAQLQPVTVATRDTTWSPSTKQKQRTDSGILFISLLDSTKTIFKSNHIVWRSLSRHAEIVMRKLSMLLRGHMRQEHHKISIVSAATNPLGTFSDRKFSGGAYG